MYKMSRYNVTQLVWKKNISLLRKVVFFGESVHGEIDIKIKNGKIDDYNLPSLIYFSISG